MPFLFLKNYWKSIIVFVIILILSTASFNSIPNVARFKHSDKIVHIFMFIGLGLILVYDYMKDQYLKLKISNLKWYLFILGVFLGGLIELIQKYLTISRTAELYDWFADIVGLSLGFIIGYFINRAILSFKKNHK